MGSQGQNHRIANTSYNSVFHLLHKIKTTHDREVKPFYVNQMDSKLKLSFSYYWDLFSKDESLPSINLLLNLSNQQNNLCIQLQNVSIEIHK